MRHAANGGRLLQRELVEPAQQNGVHAAPVGRTDCDGSCARRFDAFVRVALGISEQCQARAVALLRVRLVREDQLDSCATEGPRFAAHPTIRDGGHAPYWRWDFGRCSSTIVAVPLRP